MRILHVISSLDRKAGGPPVALAGLARAQAKLDVSVSVVSTFAAGADMSLADELRSAGVEVTLIGPAKGKFQRHDEIVTTLSSLIAQADVVHIHTLWEEIQHQAATIARRRGVPYVFVPHGMLDPWSLGQRRWVKRAYLAWRLRRDLNGAMFIHVLNADEARLIQPLRLTPHCEVIPNGIDPIEPLPETAAFEKPYVLFLSRLHPKKGLDYLADAFAIVAAARPDVRLVVAGPDDGAEKDFDARITASGLAGRVQRVGPLYGEAKLAAMRGAELLVLPSRQEGFSVAIVEALACGTPVVISEQCHFPEIASEAAGQVVSLDAKSVANGMLVLLNDASAREAASGRARELASRYTWGRIARQTLDLYGRKSLAIFANSMTPYRIALHRRFAREIPDLKLYSLYTDAKSNAPWELTPPPEIGPVSFTHLPKSRQGAAVIGWIRRNRPAAVLVNGYNERSRLAVLRWCRHHGVPVMLWGDSNIRGDRASGLKAIVKKRLVGWALRQTDAVLACGSLGEAYFQKYGADPQQIFRVPVEPDYDLIRSVRQEQVSAVQAKYGWREDRRRLVYSGRLIGIKRVDLLLSAFAAIAPERPQWDLVIVGDGELRRPLEGSVSPALASRITWCGFVADQGEISAIYRACDVLVHPPDVEPWALVINEAAAAGLAIIASDAVGAAAELVRDGVNGRVFPAGDVAALRAVLLDVTAHSPSYKAASADVLAAWREQGDPVNGMRKALQSLGLGQVPGGSGRR
jgi:glycosyltransferase involved in cell wall biosynthesis